MATITKTQLENASRDADDFATIVNGNSTTTVSTRLGATIPTVSKFIADKEAEIDALTPEIIGYRDDAQAAATAAASSASTLSSALVDGLRKIVPTVADLRNVGKTTCHNVVTLGYYAAGDGGSSNYRYDPSDTTSTDNGGTVIVAADNGRWKLTNPNATPKQFGCKGDGSTVDTIAFNKWVDWVNSSGLRDVSLDLGLVYLLGPINSFTTLVTIRGNGSTLKCQGNSWLTSGDGTTFLSIAGYGTRLFDLTIDGNKSAFTSAPAGRLLGFGKGVSAYNVTIKNSPQQGVRHDAGTGATILQTSGDFENLQILDCAGTGLELASAQFMKFSKMRILRCGYGYGITRLTPADISSLNTNGFGMVVRYRSHDLTFVDCDFLDNGRDGAGVGQGSYNVKFIGCAANRNGDGGYTLFNDVVSPGRPGDGEVPSNIDYIGCTASTNYGSGLASYCPTHNVTVYGGKFYNNHILAGDIPFQSSHYSGLYFANGCTGLDINTQAYDNRQIRVIAGVSGSGSTRVITASDWVSGSKDYAPKVSFYDSTLNWQGYAKITAESTGSVTVSATAYDSVNLASIASGWYITQATQHNGCFFDNNVMAKVKIDGFGHRGGPSGLNLSGRDVVSGSFAGGQNVRVYGNLNTTELVANPSFEADLSNWTFSVPGGGSATRDTGTIRKSAAALKLIGGTSAAQGDATLVGSAIKFAGGQFVELNVDAYADAPNGCYVQLFYSAAPYVTTVWHPGGSKWKRLTIGAYIPIDSAYLIVRLYSQAGKTCYFDNVSLRVLDEGRDYRETSFYSNNLPY